MVSLAPATLAPVSVGVDIGQVQDPTALCIAETTQVATGKYRTRGYIPVSAHLGVRGEWIPAKGPEEVMRTEYTIRHIERLPLGTSYPDVSLYLANLLSNKLFARRSVRVLLDCTGVGRPVYDSLRAEIALRKETQHIRLCPISFVHGERYNRTTGSLGKAYLVSRLQSLLQSTRVHAPDTPEMRATLEELRTYQIKVSDDGKDTYGGATGKHDDLATALALACLEDPWSERVTYSEKRVY